MMRPPYLFVALPCVLAAAACNAIFGLERWELDPGTGGSSAGGSGAGGSSAGPCSDHGDCPAVGECSVPQCQDGICDPLHRPAGTGCSENGGDVCDGEGSCLSSDGRPCSEPAECLSGSCADAVCCDTPCDGLCAACDLEPAGVCSLHPPAYADSGECGAGVCDGSGACATGEHRWSKRFGDTTDLQLGRAVAMDAQGNVITAGHFHGTVDFGSGALGTGGIYDVFLAKLGQSGQPVWSKSFGSYSWEQRSSAVAVDSQGNVIITGEFYDTVDFSGGSAPPLTNAGSRDAYVAKLTADGQHVWSRQVGGIYDEYGRSVAVDDDDNVLLLGQYQSSQITLCGSTLTNAGSFTFDVFLIRLDPATGNCQWLRSFGDGFDDGASDVATDGSNVVITGGFMGNITFPPLSPHGSTAGSVDVYVAKLDGNGSALWSKHYGDGFRQQGLAVTTDSQGNVIVAGIFEGTIDFNNGTGVHSSDGGFDIFLLKLAPGGSYLTSVRLGDSKADQFGGLDVAVDGSDNIIVAGDFTGQLSLSPAITLSSVAGSEDVFLVKLAPDLTPLWGQRFGDGQPDGCQAVAVSPAGDIAITGAFYGDILLNPQGSSPLTSAGGSDIFVASFGP